MANSAPCNECYYCRIDRHNLCENLRFLNGAYSEFIVVPESIVRQNLYRVPPGISFERMALLEPLACVVHGVERTGFKMDHIAAVIVPLVGGVVWEAVGAQYTFLAGVAIALLSLALTLRMRTPQPGRIKAPSPIQ